MSTELSSVPCKDLVCKSLDQLESSNANHRGTLPGAKQGLILNTEGLGEIIPRLGPTPGWRSVLKGTDSNSIIIVLSCNFYASEIPSDDNPASTACGSSFSTRYRTHCFPWSYSTHRYFLTILNYPVAVGQWSGGDKASSPKTINGKVM